MVIFTLAKCPQCHTHYAATQDPSCPSRWVFFERRSNDFEHPTHVCVGGMLCLMGHDLVVTAREAVLSDSGDWVRLTSVSVPPSVN